MGHIYICITIDWEGESLDDINELVKLRNTLDQDIPFTHFICPNYFILDSNKIAADIIKTAIKPMDEVGLHIHCYKELMNTIPEVKFRTEENYHNTPGWFEKNIIQKVFPKYNRNISGRGVPLSVYNDREIKTIIEYCKNLLVNKLEVSNIKGFRAGGWIANDTVLETVEENGFKYDSSAVAPSILSKGFNKENTGNKKDDFGDKNGIFTEHIIKLWGFEKISEGFLKNENILRFNKNEALQIHSQPFKYNSILEIPNNCGLTDFCSPKDTVIPLVKQYQESLKADPNKNYLIVYGCHQEGDAFYKKQLLDFIREILNMDSSVFKFIKMEEVLEFEWGR